MWGIEPTTLGAALILYLVAVNLIALVAFGLDKAFAVRGSRRIPEKTLMLFATIGGGAGALFGMYLFHHKTQKPLFRRGVPVLLVVQVALVAWIAHSLISHQLEKNVAPELQEATVAYVVDGDTVDVMVDGAEKRVRMAGIDAPESASHDEGANTPEGSRATEFARSILRAGQAVYLQKDVSETDKYDRLVRYVWLEVPNNPHDSEEIASKMANAIIVEAGYAQAYRYWPDVSYQEHFEAAQQRAVDTSAGVSYLWKA